MMPSWRIVRIWHFGRFNLILLERTIPEARAAVIATGAAVANRRADHVRHRTERSTTEAYDLVQPPTKGAIPKDFSPASAGLFSDGMGRRARMICAVPNRLASKARSLGVSNAEQRKGA